MEVVWGIFFNQKLACFEKKIIWKQLVTEFKTQTKFSKDFD